MKQLKTMVVCGTGMGSSLLLKVQVERVVRENKLPITVTSDVVSAAKGSDADFFISMLDLVSLLAPLGKPVVGIKNIVSRQEILVGLQSQIEAFNK